MSKEHPVNKSASARDRLRNLSLKNGRNFQEIVQYYAMERFLYRLGQSEFRNSFVLKGALMLRVWGIPQAQATMDIDLLGMLNNSSGYMEQCVRNILQTPVPDDGLMFDPESVTSTAITHDADYRGRRVLFFGYLERMKIRMKLDIGFSDVVLPAPCPIHFPTALDMEPPILHGYTRESAIAEKFHAMVFLGIQNSSMKDFYDIYVLSSHYAFDGTLLSQALQGTFERRHTPLPDSLVIASSLFLKMKEVPWTSFLEKIPPSRRPEIPTVLNEVVQRIEAFLLPPCQAALGKAGFARIWNPSAARWN